MALSANLPDRLVVPVLDAEDVVVVNINALPEEPEELLEILAAEAAPLSTWFDFARAYLAPGKENPFIHIVSHGVKDEGNKGGEGVLGAREAEGNAGGRRGPGGPKVVVSEGAALGPGCRAPRARGS